MAIPGDFMTIVERQDIVMPVEIVQDCTKAQLPLLAWGVEWGQ